MSEYEPDPNVKIESVSSSPLSSEFDELLSRLRKSPHDPQGWSRLRELADASENTEQFNEAYEALLKNYPHTAEAEIAFINRFFNIPDLRRGEELLNRFLRPSPFVDLWRFYLNFVRRVNQNSTTRETVRKAYEFALTHIGQDRDSGSIWAEYIQFLHSAETTTTWETQQKMDALRKVYQRAVQIPLDNVEKLWSDMEAFETGLNKLTAKKFMTDLSAAHTQARSVLRRLTEHLNGLIPPSSGMYLPVPSQIQDRTFVGRWKAYLKWEESNPLMLEEKDQASLNARIKLAYRKAVVRMRYYPEIWFMAYSWTASVAAFKPDEAMTILKAGLEANPDSFALTYAYVELLEKAEMKKDTKNFAEVDGVYDRFFKTLRPELARLTVAISAASAPEEPKEEPAFDPNGMDFAPGMGVAAEVEQRKLSDHKQQQIKQLKEELEEKRKQFGNVWINYMRFARRSQGQLAHREAFGKARKDEYIPFEVFEAAAMTEHRCNQEDGTAVATRIFEAGMKRFGTDAQYVDCHLAFLININDENNARALFERVIGTFPPKDAKPIWERWTRARYQFDDLEAVMELERRMAEVYPADAPIKRFAQRYTYYGIDAIADHDLGFSKTRKLGNANSQSTSSIPSSTVSAPAPLNPVSQISNKRPPPVAERAEHKRPRQDDRDRNRRFPSPPAQKQPPTRQEVKLPSVLHDFVMMLPGPETFDGVFTNAIPEKLLLISQAGPVFNTENFLMTLKNVRIPSLKPIPPSPPPVKSGGRPPPDYSPYQGPHSNPRGRRY
ncbi:unnamed protein product [Mycena citricolor]|uniref:mRNA 3'-end-processing protein RNA14 n=1 Tax=Mycena citricolor TaxID=2018698 RepID=A0AAD2HIP5_9AGAR|nr:unnamed protein product [Mycena citricolor]